jgi:hypothetical protein
VIANTERMTLDDTRAVRYCLHMSAKLTYTPPAEIDGEPEDVRELSIGQLGEALAQLAELAEETVVQLRAAGVGREGEEWEESWEAQNCGFAVGAISRALEAQKWLARAV